MVFILLSILHAKSGTLYLLTLERRLLYPVSNAKGQLLITTLKPGFHIVVSVVSVVRNKFIGQIKLYGNVPYKCSIQKK